MRSDRLVNDGAHTVIAEFIAGGGIEELQAVGGNPEFGEDCRGRVKRRPSRPTCHRWRSAYGDHVWCSAVDFS